LSEDYCIGYAHVDKHVSTRCLEVIETVANQRVFVWSPPSKHIYGHCSSGAASNPVVQNHVVLGESPNRDPCAIRAKSCVFGRRHRHIVVHDDGALHGPGCNLAEYTDALCLRPSQWIELCAIMYEPRFATRITWRVPAGPDPEPVVSTLRSMYTRPTTRRKLIAGSVVFLI